MTNLIQKPAAWVLAFMLAATGLSMFNASPIHAMRTTEVVPFGAASPRTAATYGVTPLYSTPSSGVAYNAMTVVVDLAALAASATPAFDVSIEHSVLDNSTAWATHTSFTTLTAAATGNAAVSKQITNFGKYWRVKVQLGAAGGLTATFTIKAFVKEFTDSGVRDKEIMLAMHQDWMSAQNGNAFGTWVSDPQAVHEKEGWLPSGRLELFLKRLVGRG